MEELKRSLKLQEYHNSYTVNNFEMAYKDMKLYLQKKKKVVFLDLSFIDIVKNAFLLQEDLDFTPISDKLTKLNTAKPIYPNLLIRLLLIVVIRLLLTFLLLGLRTLPIIPLLRMLLPLTLSGLLVKT